MKRLMLLALCFSALLNSCSQDIEEVTPDAGRTEDETPQTRFIRNNDYYALGVSYDITDEYLGIDATKLLVVDIEAYLQDYPDTYYDNPTTSGVPDVYVGATAREFSEDITKKWKGSLAASAIPLKWLGSASVSYGSDLQKKNTFSTKFAYTRADLTKRVKRVYMNADPSTLRNYVYPQFLADLNRYSADQFVRMYGTHVLLDVTLGGRLQFNYRSEIVEETSLVEKKRAASAGLGAVIKMEKLDFSGSYDYINNTTYAQKNASWDVRMKYLGGENSGISLSFNSESSPTTNVNLAAWESSVNANNATIIDVNWNMTYPIYEFIADPAKKTEVKAAVERYIKESELNIIEVKPLYRLYRHNGANSFYTTSYEQAMSYINTFGFFFDYGDTIENHYVQGYVYATQQPGTLPLYRLHVIKGDDTFLTMYYSEADYYIKNKGFYFDYGNAQCVRTSYILGYVHPSQQSGTLPLYRIHNAKYRNTFYTTSYGQASYYVSRKGFYYDNGDPKSPSSYLQGYLLPYGNN